MFHEPLNELRSEGQSRRGRAWDAVSKGSTRPETEAALLPVLRSRLVKGLRARLGEYSLTCKAVQVGLAWQSARLDAAGRRMSSAAVVLGRWAEHHPKESRVTPSPPTKHAQPNSRAVGLAVPMAWYMPTYEDPKIQGPKDLKMTSLELLALDREPTFSHASPSSSSRTRRRWSSRPVVRGFRGIRTNPSMFGAASR